VGIRHREYLPYTQPLSTLARFFALYPEPHSRSRELLARWVWRGAVTAQHKGDTVSTRRTLEAIQPGDEHGSVQSLLATLERREPDLDVERFQFQTARSKVHTLALLSLGPRAMPRSGSPSKGPSGPP
jgi:hypothetical protein